jgi:hypothetical protein
MSEAYFGGLGPEPDHCHLNDFGGYQPNPTAEAGASGGNKFNSNPATSHLEHASLRGTSNPARKAGCQPAQASGYAGTSNPFASTNHTQSFQTVALHYPYIHAAYHPWIYYPHTYRHPTHPLFPACPHPSSFYGAACRYNIFNHYTNPSPPPPCPRQIPYVPHIHNSIFPSETNRSSTNAHTNTKNNGSFIKIFNTSKSNGSSPNAYNSSRGGAPWNGELLGKSAGSASVEHVMNSSRAGGATSEKDWGTDIGGFRDDSARGVAWDTTNPETSIPVDGGLAEITGSRGAQAQAVHGTAQAQRSFTPQEPPALSRHI